MCGRKGEGEEESREEESGEEPGSGKRGGKTDSNGAPQFPRTRNFLPGQAQGLWVPLVVAIEIQPLVAQTDHWGCSFNI